MEHLLNLKEKYFDLIYQGVKTIEGRLYDEKRREFKLGDMIKFKNQNSDDIFMARITSLTVYKSFDDIPSDLYAKLGFEGYSQEEFVREYHRFYTTEQENLYGVLLIGIEKM